MTKIVVFGGLGYIGSNLVTELFSDNHEIIVGDNVSYDVERNWFDWFQTRDGIDFKFMDIKNPKDMESVIERSDVVVNLSALVGETICKKDPKNAYDVNYHCAVEMSNLCQKHSKKLIFLSTCSNYGISTDLCDENSPLNPLTIYARTKVGVENHILKKNPLAIILRMSTVFGASLSRTRMDIIPNQFLKEALQNETVSVFQPEAVRPIIHVNDAVNIIKQIALSNTKYQVYNCGFDKMNHTKKEMVDIVSELTGASMELVESTDKRTYKVDFSRLHDEFDIPHSFNLRYGLKDLLDQIKKFDLPMECGNY